MFFEAGFLGTRAAMYMDVVTLYFALLPMLVAYAIRLAARGAYERHYRMQMVVLALTLVIVVIFEVGVRFGGGFLDYAETSGMNYGFLVVFLIVHILIAIATVAAWQACSAATTSKSVCRRRARRAYRKSTCW
jgi:putative membrane protein